MALTENEKLQIGREWIRKSRQRSGPALAVSKAQLRAATQALDEWYDAHKVDASNRVETAAPGAFTNADKKQLGAAYFYFRFTQDK